MRNAYINDAGLFLQETAKTIKEEMNRSEIILASLSFALGIERILKGLLFNLNPTYILDNPEFKNSIKVLYSDKLLADIDSHKELSKKPNEDVITFKKSLLRVQAVSNTSYKYRNILFYLSDMRDIIVHHELQKLDLDKLKETLKRDFYPIINEYITEIDKDLRSKYLQEHHIRLAKLSSKLQTDLERQIELTLESHRAIWEKQKKIEGYFDSKVELTKTVLSTPNKFPIKCPACENTAVIYGKEIKEIDKIEKEDKQIGLQISRVKCHYCKLRIDQPEEIDFLEQKYQISISNSDDISKIPEFRYSNMSDEELEALVESYIQSEIERKMGK